MCGHECMRRDGTGKGKSALCIALPAGPQHIENEQSACQLIRNSSNNQAAARRVCIKIDSNVAARPCVCVCDRQRVITEDIFSICGAGSLSKTRHTLGLSSLGHTRSSSVRVPGFFGRLFFLFSTKAHE